MRTGRPRVRSASAFEATVPEFPEVPNTGLDELELRVLSAICKQGKYHSSVALTADLYGEAEVDEDDDYDDKPLEWVLVESILVDLNILDLCVYRLSTRYASRGMFVHIRPTQEAYELLKIEAPWYTIAGAGWHSYREIPLRRGDNTDFRSHKPKAEASPVIKEDFVIHCSWCTPDHFEKHRDQLVEYKEELERRLHDRR